MGYPKELEPKWEEIAKKAWEEFAKQYLDWDPDSKDNGEPSCFGSNDESGACIWCPYLDGC